MATSRKGVQKATIYIGVVAQTIVWPMSLCGGHLDVVTRMLNAGGNTNYECMECGHGCIP